MSKQSEKSEEIKVIKKDEFRAFLQAIEFKQAAHWVDIARAIGVDNDTITKWKQLPEAQEAIQKGIRNALDGMESAGKRDWRMYESKLKMLGVNPAQKVEHSGQVNSVSIILKEMGLLDDDGNRTLISTQRQAPKD